MSMNPEYNDVDYVNALNAKRAEAARINGAKSQGPKIEEGKAVSSQNAVKHGLRSKSVVLKNEGPQEFEEFRQGFVESHNPQNGSELDLVHKIAAVSWRLKRIESIETDLFDDCLEKDRKLHDAFIDYGNNLRFSTFNRYEVSLSNQLHKLYQTLLKVQAKRKQEEADLHKRTQEETQTELETEYERPQNHNQNLHKRTQQRGKKQKQHKPTQHIATGTYGIWNKRPEPTDQN